MDLQLSSRKAGKAFKIAGKSARHAILVGDNEVESGTFAVKRLADGVQSEVGLDGLVACVLGEGVAP